MNTAAANGTTFYLSKSLQVLLHIQYLLQSSTFFLLKVWSMASSICISWKLLEMQNPRLHPKPAEPDSAF